jgi:hypothetical protein
MLVEIIAITLFPKIVQPYGRATDNNGTEPHGVTECNIEEIPPRSRMVGWLLGFPAGACQ